MIGRNRDDKASESNTVYLVGSDRISTELDAIAQAANRALRTPLTLDYEFNDPADPEQLYTRSDHYSYASQGHSGHLLHDRPPPRLSRQHRRGVEDRVRQDDAHRRVRLRDRPGASPTSITRRCATTREHAWARRRRPRTMTRPLLIIFLTIFVNLIGFGIIIPLLPFYAETFGASPARDRPAVRGVLAVPAGRGAGARRPVGSLRPASGARLQPRRHGRQLRDAGAGAQRRDAVPGAHRRRPVGRQHLDGARLRRRRHRAEGSRARVRADRRGVRARLHHRAGAQRRAGEGQLHGADLGGGRAHARRDGDGVALAAGNGASRAGRHRQPVPLSAGAAAAARSCAAC